MVEPRTPRESAAPRDFTLDLGARVRRLRDQQEVSLETLAKAADVSIGYLSLLERGERTPGAWVLHKLSDALNVPVGYLLGEERAQSRDFHPVLEDVAKLLESLDREQRDQLEQLLHALVGFAQPARVTTRERAGDNNSEPEELRGALFRKFSGDPA